MCYADVRIQGFKENSENYDSLYINVCWRICGWQISLQTFIKCFYGKSIK